MRPSQKLVDASGVHPCAVNQSSQVSGWGQDNEGHLGNRTAGVQSTAPVPVDPGQTFHVVASSKDIEVPPSYPLGVAFTGMSNFSVKVSVPANATLLSAS